MIRKTVRALVVVGALIVGGRASAQTALPPAATLLSKYSEAVGGQAFLAAKSVHTKGSLSMPAQGINATFELTQVAPNLMSMVTDIPGLGQIHTGFDGTVAWAMDPMQGARVLAGAELDQIRDEADRRSAVRALEMFSSVATVADTTINSERCYLVKLTWKSGRETFDCFSATTGFVVATRSTQKTPMGDIPVLTLFSDYKKFGNVSFPTKTVQEAMGTQQIITINSVEFGAGAAVTPPPAVQALVNK